MRITTNPRTTRRTASKIAARSRTSLTILAILAAAPLGCSGEGIEEGEPVVVAPEEIKNGIYVGYAKGLLELKSAAGSCTAAMIGRHWAITAAHCIRTTDGNPNADFVGTAYYFDPDTQTKRPVSDTNETFRAHHVGTWDGPGSSDYQDDFAVFARKQFGWKSTDGSDYLALNASSNLSGLEQYGRGYFSDAEDGAGVLRKRSVIPKDSDKHWFYDLEATRGVCKGDSGGPYINKISGLQTISGIAASAQIEDDDVCAYDGARQYAARVNSRVGWLVNTLGLPCRIDTSAGWAVCNGHNAF